ncbi:MAG: thymidylate kinase [Actinobacteria bacterium]|nr:thymidylate kinase [Actinomycetota bacterium]MBI3686017.1 thymidylate kinase [Actinomycetota bacterium]
MTRGRAAEPRRSTTLGGTEAGGDEKRGLWWVSVEGLNGVGKTYLSQRLAARLGAGCRLLGELTDARQDEVTARVIGALTRPGATFLRTGHPLTETFALLALKVREFEQLQPPPPGVSVIVEDRGVDTVAVYQAAILTAGRPVGEAVDVVDRVHQAAAAWRPAPDVTLLIIDDLDTCVARFADRTGVPVSTADRALLMRVADLYTRLAAAHPDRFQVIERSGRSEEQTVESMYTHARPPQPEGPGPRTGRGRTA